MAEGGGAPRGLGLCQAPTRWLSCAGQKSHRASRSRCWILCLGTPASSGSVPSGGPGDAFPMEANSKPGRPSVPEEPGAGVPAPHEC